MPGDPSDSIASISVISPSSDRSGSSHARERQRERIVGDIRPTDVVVNIRLPYGGGSSSVFSNALLALSFIRSASSRITTLVRAIIDGVLKNLRIGMPSNSD